MDRKSNLFHGINENEEYVFPMWNENGLVLYRKIFSLDEEEYEEYKEMEKKYFVLIGNHFLVLEKRPPMRYQWTDQVYFL